MSENDIQRIDGKLDQILEMMIAIGERITRVEEGNKFQDQQIKELCERPKEKTNSIAKWVGIIGGTLGAITTALFIMGVKQ